MTWPTHALFGINALWLLAPLSPQMVGYDFGILATLATLGALLPDLDASQSKIKHLKVPGTQFKPFLLPAQVVHRTEQHRGLLHSIAGLGMAAIMTAPLMFWTGWAPLSVLLLGYGSHLFADSLTQSGIRLLYPQERRFYLLPKRWRITTGSQAECLVATSLLPLVLLLLLGQMHP